jgi:high-affinity K+ transport system ATPase subunit B
MRTETKAKRLQAANSDSFEQVDATTLVPGDLVLVEAGDLIPSDGEIIQGVASVGGITENGHPHRYDHRRQPTDGSRDRC